MPNTHVACYQLEMRLRDEIDQLKDHIESLELDLENAQYDLDEAQEQISRSRLDEETEIEAELRKLLEELDDTASDARRAAQTAKIFPAAAENTADYHDGYIAGLLKAVKIAERYQPT